MGAVAPSTPRFKYVFSDMDGTLLNSRSALSAANAEALNEALGSGLKVIIATGKTRPAAISLLKNVPGLVSESGAGIFCQGLLVYGRGGKEIFRKNLDQDFCRQAFLYSHQEQIPVVAFSEDRCLTLFEHPLVDSLHTVYHEPKAEVMDSVDLLSASGGIQKLVFLDTAEAVAAKVRPYWEAHSGENASVVQAMPDMLEVVPAGTCKGLGVGLLLDHLGVERHEVMAIGDGENDVEMLQLAGLGVAMSNACKKARAAADVVGLSNDEDGVADAIRRFAL